MSAFLNDNKFVIGSCIAGLIGWKYGVPNLRYFQQITRLGYWNFQRDLMPSDMVEIEFTVSLTDIDFNRHMNNAAYLRYAEAGRVAWFRGLVSFFRDTAQSLALLGLSVKYRRECLAGDVITLQTKICYWDQCNIYIRQEFYHKKTGLVHCVMYCRFGLLQNGKLIKREQDDKAGFHAIKWYSDSDGHVNDYECREPMDESLKFLISHLRTIKEHKL